MKLLIKTSMLLFIGLWSSLSHAEATGPYVSLSVSHTDISVNEMLDVEVLLHDAFTLDPTDELLGFGFNTQSTGTGSLQFLGSTVNTLFEDTAASVGLDVAGFVFPGLNSDSVGSVFSLATLHFQALSVGNVSLAVVVDLMDFNQGLIFSKQIAALPIDANLDLNVAAVPLPPSALLFFSAGIFAWAGRFKQTKRG